jgi:hypothetical protein
MERLPPDRDPKSRKKPTKLEMQLRWLEQTPLAFDQIERAARVELARALVHETFARYGRRAGKEEERAVWEKAARVFHKVLREVYPPGFWEAVKQLKGRDGHGLEPAITFLEIDPWFFRSGYVKADLLRYICRMEIPGIFEQRLREVVLQAIKLRDRREFRYYCRLARKIDSPDLRSAIEPLCQHMDEGIRRRANWVLGALRGQKKNAS